MTSPLVTFESEVGETLSLEIDHGRNATIYIDMGDHGGAFELSPVDALHLADLIQRYVRTET